MHATPTTPLPAVRVARCTDLWQVKRDHELALPEVHALAADAGRNEHVGAPCAEAGNDRRLLLRRCELTGSSRCVAWLRGWRRLAAASGSGGWQHGSSSSRQLASHTHTHTHTPTCHEHHATHRYIHAMNIMPIERLTPEQLSHDVHGMYMMFMARSGVSLSMGCSVLKNVKRRTCFCGVHNMPVLAEAGAHSHALAHARHRWRRAQTGASTRTCCKGGTVVCRS
jgi:hypothetical protein